MDDEQGPLRVKRKVEGAKVVERVSYIPDFRPAGLMLGDAVTNYRAALDHMVWDLVQLRAQRRLTEKEARQVQFPFARSATDFRAVAHRRRRAPFITDDQWRIIGLYQQYKRDQRGRAMRLLLKVSDMDKHRRVTPTATVARSHRGALYPYGCRIVSVKWFPPTRALYVGAKLVTIVVEPTAPDYDVEVKTESLLRPSIGRSVAIMDVAESVRDAVREVLTAMRPHI